MTHRLELVALDGIGEVRPGDDLVSIIAGKPEEVRALPDEVEGDVCEAEIDLQRGCMTAPFAEPLAQDQRIVAEPLAIFDRRGVMFARRRRIERSMVGCSLGSFLDVVFDGRKAWHQMCFTSSGMS